MVLSCHFVMGFYALVAGCGQCSFFSTVSFLLFLLVHILFPIVVGGGKSSDTEQNQSPNHFSASFYTKRSRRRRRLDEYFGCIFCLSLLFSSLIFFFWFLALVHCVCLFSCFYCGCCFALFVH